MYDLDCEESYTHNIIDILGNKLKCHIDYDQKYITFNDISNGTYFLILQDKEKKIIKRFIISL